MRKAGVITPDIERIEAGIKAGGIKGVSVLRKYHVRRQTEIQNDWPLCCDAARDV